MNNRCLHTYGLHGGQGCVPPTGYYRARGLKKKKGKKSNARSDLGKRPRPPCSLIEFTPRSRGIAARSDYQRNLVSWGSFFAAAAPPDRQLNFSTLSPSAPGTCLNEKTWEGICRLVREALFPLLPSPPFLFLPFSPPREKTSSLSFVLNYADCVT